MTRKQAITWFLQGAFPGALIAVPLFGVFLYYGLPALAFVIIAAVLTWNRPFKLRLWGFAAGSAVSFFIMWFFVVPHVSQ